MSSIIFWYVTFGFEVLPWNTVLKTQCNWLCDRYHKFHFFFTKKWSVCHLVFGCSQHCPMHFATTIALQHHCPPPLPAHSNFPTFLLHSRHIISVVIGKWFAKFHANELSFCKVLSLDEFLKVTFPQDVLFDSSCFEGTALQLVLQRVGGVTQCTPELITGHGTIISVFGPSGSLELNQRRNNVQAVTLL
jgi:hypothetical protein